MSTKPTAAKVATKVRKARKATPAKAPVVKAPEANTNASGASGAKAKSIYYVVYVDTYISDTEILPRGVYISEKKIERLDNSNTRYVKKFEGKVPDRIVHEIAAELKISIHDEDGNNRDSVDILDEMVSVL